MQNGTELRNAPAAILDEISTILDINDDWKRFMSLIPKDLRSDRFEPKYNSDHIRIIEEHANSARLSCTNVLFHEWGTSGRVRPTLDTLWKILKQAEMIRAADRLSDVMNRSRMSRPMVGPGAPVDVTGFLVDNGSSEQNKETMKLPNETPNGNSASRCGPTKKLEESAAPPFSNGGGGLFPAFDKFDPHSTKMIPNKDSDFIKFSQEPPNLPSSDYMPHFSALLPKDNDPHPRGEPLLSEGCDLLPVTIKDNDNSSISTMSGGSTGLSDSSPSPSNTTGHSVASQSSQNQSPSTASNNLYEQVNREILEHPDLIKFNYYDLENITNKFEDSPIGSGGFGDVFKGNHKDHGMLAIKRAHNKQIIKPADVMKIFNTEVKSLSVLRHTNIVNILGYSLDGPTPCIVCEFVEGGSLLENIKRKVLNKNQRMNIMIGTAEGLKHIHDTEKPEPTVPGMLAVDPFKKQYFMHGDVKSANILITKDFIPKLCDLGLSKQCAITYHTESIVGTTAYMAPERFQGTVTPKGDVYSYGIVLLELLTGLEPIVTGHESYNIKNYIEEICPNDNIIEIIDPVIGDWPEADNIHNLAKSCIEYKKNLRPSMDMICHTLNEIKLSERRVYYAVV